MGTEIVDMNASEITCELCIVGAGVSALNALFAASRYLSPRDRVVIVDEKPAAGGMWNRTYGYVRLHQPHRMFTAGNIAWTPERDPAYLATGAEVVGHLRHCVETIRSRVALDERYGYRYVSHEETTDEVRVQCEAVEPGGPPLRIKARTLIKAVGYSIQPNEAIRLSSEKVRSISPDLDDVLGDEMRASTAPVYVVGGGKTGMDTAHALVTRFPQKRSGS